MLARRGPTAELTSLWRFSQPWEARASLALRRAHPQALDTYEAHGAFNDGTPVRLPAAYVAEHVGLGYATTTARTQGITVDQTHTIAALGMAREDLYVAMSRGRHLNHTYVITEPTGDDCLPDQTQQASARDVLDAILATSHAEQTATETWDAFHPDQPPPIPPVHPRHDRRDRRGLVG